MNILFFTTWYPNKNNPVSGVFVEELAKAVSLYCNITVLHGYHDKSASAYTISDKTENNVRVIQVRYPDMDIPVLSYIFYLFTIIQAFRKILKDFKPDVIHAHVYLSGVIAVILGKIYKIPVIVTEHAEIIDKHKGGGHFRALKNSLKIILAKFALNNAQLLVLVSISLQEYLESLGINNKIIIVPNVVNTELFYPMHINKISKTKKILFVGMLTPIKGIPYLLKAINLIKNEREDFVLDIIGEGIFRKEYENLANELDIPELVRFHGRKNKEETANSMQECDFLVLPSLYETFGVVLIEAMACGKPVISTLNGGQGEFVNDRNGILVPAENPEALAKAIEYMLEHYQDYDDMLISHEIKNKFSYETIGKSLQEIYINFNE